MLWRKVDRIGSGVKALGQSTGAKKGVDKKLGSTRCRCRFELAGKAIERSVLETNFAPQFTTCSR